MLYFLWKKDFEVQPKYYHLPLRLSNGVFSVNSVYFQESMS